jgi:hypothetical protein
MEVKAMFRILLPPAVLLLVSLTVAGPAEKYTGSWPPKQDVPYLVHADTLIETEIAEAKNEDKGNDRTAWVPGISSPVRTPLAEPSFLIEVQKLTPEKIELYKFDVKRGRREVILPGKSRKSASHPLRLTVTRIEGKLYRLEANEGLENGEYSLSPDGSDQVFCFQVY